MASKTTLNAKNLEALGAERLAQLLIEISTGSGAHKRRLRLELAGSQGSVDVAREVRKRLSSIGRARTIIRWNRVKALKSDLETQRTMIFEQIAPDDPQEALELMWQFLGLAESIFERSDDGSGTIVEIFHDACADIGTLAQAAKAESGPLAERVFRAVRDDGYGRSGPLIASVAAALGNEGLERLKALFVEWSQEVEEKPAPAERRAIGRGLHGPIDEDEVYGLHRDFSTRTALEQIADAQGDADAFIAQQTKKELTAPLVAAEIAVRLLAAGRGQEALAALDRVETKNHPDIPFEWQNVRADTLEALERRDEAQAYRWQCFEVSLNSEHLRAILKRLPDFDDMEAEEKAFALAQVFPDIGQALAFFLNWPARDQAAKLVVRRRGEVDGNFYELLTPAAADLKEKHPLAATILLRAMIDFSLEAARAGRYKHAARHLVDCQALAAHIGDFGYIPSHDAYVKKLREQHAKKHGFWSLLR